MRGRKVRIMVLAAGLLATCASQADSLDWRTISFKAGHPVAGEPLEASMNSSVRDQRENLDVNVAILKKYPVVPYDVVGRASKTECDDSASCMALSVRRAQLVYDYLINHGIPACQIKSIVATGSNNSIAGKEEGSAPDQSVDVFVTKGDAC